MRLIQVFCCSLLIIALSCTGPSAPDPETARRLYQEAVSLGRHDDADRKLELLRQAVEHDPEFTEAHRKIIRLNEDKDLLRKEYERRTRENPDSVVFHYLLGEVTEGDMKQTHYEKAIELDPRSPWGYLGLGEVLEDRRSFDEAFTNYQRVLELDPVSELGHRGLARTYGLMGRREDEIAAYRKMISELPDVASGYWDLKHALEKAERESEAADVLQQIYERFTSDPNNGALALYLIAESLEDPNEKERLWVRFIQEYPTGSNLTVVHDRLLRHYVETDPERAEAFARECMSKEEFPGDRSLKHSAYRTLFELYWKAGEVEKEARLVQELMESGYPNPNPYIVAAIHYAKEGKPELAIRFYERALDFATPDNILGTVYFTGGKPKPERLVEIAEMVRADVSRSLGEILNKARRHQEAITVLRPVVGLLDRLGDRIHLELATAYEAAGQHQEALKHYATSLIDHLHDPARKPLESLFAKVHGSIEGLNQYVLNHVVQDKTEGSVAVSAPTALSLDEAILRARGLSSGEAPEFSLETLGGESLKPADLKGKVVVLDFWATWCGPCIKELPQFQATVDRWADRPEVVFLAVSVDEDDDVVRKFMSENEYDFPVARDRKVAEDFGVSAVPTLVLIGREGRIQYRHVGFDSEADLTRKLSDEIDFLLDAGQS